MSVWDPANHPATYPASNGYQPKHEIEGPTGLIVGGAVTRMPQLDLAEPEPEPIVPDPVPAVPADSIDGEDVGLWACLFLAVVISAVLVASAFGGRAGAATLGAGFFAMSVFIARGWGRRR